LCLLTMGASTMVINGYNKPHVANTARHRHFSSSRLKGERVFNPLLRISSLPPSIHLTIGSTIQVIKLHLKHPSPVESIDPIHEPSSSQRPKTSLATNLQNPLEKPPAMCKLNYAINRFCPTCDRHMGLNPIRGRRSTFLSAGQEIPGTGGMTCPGNGCITLRAVIEDRRDRQCDQCYRRNTN
jgi:hypothetical protein